MNKEAINKVVNGNNLSMDECSQVMDEIMGGEAAPSQVAAFLTALHMKGETIDEITACAKGMRKFATKVNTDKEVIDIVGTGGDRSNSFNISTAASVVAAAAGVPVAKHGNRAASSKCGTADCLEALGVKISVEPERNAAILDETNLCFMFAQRYHSAMKYVGPVRKEIGIPTVFNILGPLTNPASNTYQLLGVYSESLMEPIASVLANLGVKRAMVVHGKDNLDEISLSAPTMIVELDVEKYAGCEKPYVSYEITPEQFGLTSCAKEDLMGGEPAENAEILLNILGGEKGPKRDIVLLNAGSAIHIVKGVSIEEGIREAEEMIDSGKAMEKLKQFIEATNIA
ncbi:MAG: anthranilate phosphoribosyltransferase [Lachnospiraceae bacterium]